MKARFDLLPTDRLRVHEEVRPEAMWELVGRIRRDGRVEQPILVASDDWVILDGHHRFAALKALGARRVPAWIVEYDSDEIRLERWEPGPPLAKREVVARAVRGEPFPPKTTRHRLAASLPARSTSLDELLKDG